MKQQNNCNIENCIISLNYQPFNSFVIHIYKVLQKSLDSPHFSLDLASREPASRHFFKVVLSNSSPGLSKGFHSSFWTFAVTFCSCSYFLVPKITPARRFPKSYWVKYWHISEWCAVCALKNLRIKEEVQGLKNYLHQINII